MIGLKVGNIVVVIGGVGGIGLELVWWFVVVGMNVVLVDMKEDVFEEVVMEFVGKGGGDIVVECCDVLDLVVVNVLCDWVFD